MKKPEVLAPAGDLEKLRVAYMYGADACYMGMKSVSMRVKGSTMDIDDIEEALRITRALGKKLYLTMNIYAHENKMNFLEKEIARLKELKKKNLIPDGLLISDPGIMMHVRQECPWIDIHVSTQANTLNSSACEFWAKLGVTRVVLGREVSLREVKQIREKLKEKGIDIELEAFVHGAMCMAYSGRCLLSNFMSSRDANEGMCAHSCRWNYKMFYLEESKRPNEYIPVYEDDEGTSIMSAKDMCMVEHMDDVIDSGIDSAKIEGRHKTVFYTAITSRIYRQAMDLAADGKKPTPELLDLAETINTRGYFTGFWYEKPGAEGQKYTGDLGDYNSKYCFAGVIRKVDGNMADMEVRNTLRKGDRLDIITPTTNIPAELDEFRNASDDRVIDVAHPGQEFTIRFSVSEEVKAGYVVRKHI
ncbi:U32 family peptidase C-terminal domain-containing protein [Patescibacteria group bacterium]|nr:U32 family peptidase C-terminal domain-containing protein [Patescibacteria group bacterium]MBU1016401.1 U32 family peptidase C-terminal domain-containing protein [Patescibacteria group bacterium]MBU1685149.1 U32 family peptidase C-terminal domain-containing protein [Patescibacteria group bacterium]MBU1938806.1 U32 family peptidase C-terminal domain-containing protein [Patescibacteria group bacterium]